jgi:hypothetical protein
LPGARDLFSVLHSPNRHQTPVQARFAAVAKVRARHASFRGKDQLTKATIKGEILWQQKRIP